MKKITFICFAILLHLSLFGQSTYYKKFNFEPFLGITYPLNSINTASNHLGPDIGFEFRYNFKNVPIDIGLQTNIAVAVRKYNNDDLALRNVSLSITSDYNWLRDNNFSPFVGTSIGIASRRMTAPHTGEDYWGTNDVGGEFAIKGGFLFFHHLRTTLECRITNKRYNVFVFRIGYAF